MFDYVGKKRCPNCDHLMTSHSLGVINQKRGRKTVKTDAIFCEECKGEGIGKPCFVSTKPRGGD